jgi:Flp pilus assembly protein TadG
VVHAVTSRRTRDETGAIAVLAGITFSMVFILCAMVVQLGFSRDIRRQSQNASDASALAAAQTLFKDAGAPDFTGAVDKAKAYAQTNFGVALSAWNACTDPGRPAGWYSPSTPCISFDSQTKPTQVRVFMPTRETRTAVGAGAGVKSLPIGSLAVASVATPTPGLRPWGICSEQLPAAADAAVTMIFMPGNGHTSTHGCSASNAGGNWWLMKCPEDGNGGTPETAKNITDGCDDAVAPVANQPTDNTLTSFLKAACPGRSSTCLGGDTGNNLSVFADEWQTLVGKTITMPVFCDQPDCSGSTVTGTGTNAIYPVWRMVSVEICGFRLNKKDSTSWPGGTDPCTSKNTANYNTTSNWFGDKEDGFFAVFRTLDKPLDPSTDPTQKAWLVK